MLRIILTCHAHNAYYVVTQIFQRGDVTHGNCTVLRMSRFRVNMQLKSNKTVKTYSMNYW